MCHLSLSLLGPMQVTFNGKAIVTFPYEKVRALLAYLAVESHYPHHRDTLAALLWADRTQTDARSNLRKALSTLRHLLDDTAHHPSLLLTTRNTVQFNPACEAILDVTIFKELLDRYQHHSQAVNAQAVNENKANAIAALEQAVALYRGSFLDRLHLPDSEAFELWMLQQRQQLHDQIIDAYTDLVKYHELQGNAQKAQQYAAQQLQLEPWNEAAHRCLMRILTQCGRRTAALRQYDRCCQILERELAAEPDAATVELRRSICSGSLPG